jgi:hypothetical protein
MVLIGKLAKEATATTTVPATEGDSAATTAAPKPKRKVNQKALGRALVTLQKVMMISRKERELERRGLQNQQNQQNQQSS